MVVMFWQLFATGARLMALLFTLLLAGCNTPYTVTLNERILYSPNPLSTSGLLEDPNLQGCLNETMKANEMEDPESIRLLACPSADIESLVGIEALSNLEHLDLSDNDITDLSPLASLGNLRVLGLRDNNIRSIMPLLDLPVLRFVSLQGNPDIPCRQLEWLQKKIGNAFNLPIPCRS